MIYTGIERYIPLTHNQEVSVVRETKEASDSAVDDFLPLKPVWFQMMLALAAGPLHGYGIRQEVEGRTGGRITLWPTTLYGSISRMEDDGLIREAQVDESPDDDVERHYYELTEVGKAVLAMETDRLSELVTLSRSRIAGTAG